MQLEKQVSNLELSQKLKKLGVKQESLFYWNKEIADEDYEINNWRGKFEDQCFSAFTVAELGEMLPQNIIVKKKFSCRRFKRIVEENREEENLFYINPSVNHSGLKTIDYITYNDNIGTLLNGYPMINEKTEANARAKMLIYLLENKLINPKQ